MIIYLTILFITAIFAIINLFIEKKRMTFYYIILCIILTFGVAFRDNLGGTDYIFYEAAFNSSATINHFPMLNPNFEMERGYEILSSIIKTITKDPKNFFAIVCFITLPPFLFINYKRIKFPFFSLFFFIYKSFFYTFMIALRQSFALVIFLIAIESIKKKKFLKYIFLIFIASLFHDSAFFLLPLYFVNRISFDSGKMKIYILIAIFISLFSQPIFQLIGNLANVFNLQSIAGYFDFYSKDTLLNLNLIEGVFFYFLFKSLANVKEIQTEYKVFIIYFLLLVSFSQYSIISRINIYFYFPIMMLLSSRIEQIKNKKLQILVVYSLMIVFTLGFCKYIIQFDYGHFMQYRNNFFR